jgi:hypothetical protein
MSVESESSTWQVEGTQASAVDNCPQGRHDMPPLVDTIPNESIRYVRRMQLCLTGTEWGITHE